MKKRWSSVRRILLLGVPLLFVVWVIIALPIREEKVQLVVRVFLEDINLGAESNYQVYIQDYFNSQNIAVTFLDSAQDADLIIAEHVQDGGVSLVDSTVGEPVELESDQLISPVYTPSVTLKIIQSTVTGLGKTLIEQNLVQVFKEKLSNSPTWTLNALGDIILGRWVYKKSLAYNDFTSPFKQTANQTSSSDLTLANLETTVADGLYYPTEGLNFTAPAKALAGLKAAGIDAVNLANNHSVNGGTAAFNAMLDNLTAQSIGYFGGGNSSIEARQSKMVEVKGIKVALVGYSSIVGSTPASSSSPGLNYFSIAPWGDWDEVSVQQIEADIKTARTQADLVIFYVHWGQEYTHAANDHQRQVAHRAVDAGADLVLGTHPHWVQGLEWYKDKLIIYSLGNFVFDQEWSLKTKQGVWLNAEFMGNKLIQAKLVPYQIEDYHQPQLVTDSQKQQILQDIYSHSWWIR